MRIRPQLAEHEDQIIQLIAERMRLTLIQVLGEDRGGSMYEMDWLVDRVRFHMDPTRCTGRIIIAELDELLVAGHTIVRVENKDEGLFSTIYVAPPHRGRGIGQDLVSAGEHWFRSLRVARMTTYTHPKNAGLIHLFKNRGYSLTPIDDDFVSQRVPPKKGSLDIYLLTRRRRKCGFRNVLIQPHIPKTLLDVHLCLPFPFPSRERSSSSWISRFVRTSIHKVFLP